MTDALRGRRGFSLFEAIMGLAFLAFGILALTSLQTTSIRGNTFSSHLMQATYVAQDRLEYLRNLPIDSSALQAGEHALEPITLSGVLFNRSYSIDARGDLRTITYRVSWNDGVDHHLTFSTIRSQ